jgi:UDP-2,3-diacylglucosamine pyrophosphatase LpxH
MIEHAKELGYDGVICGHIHKAEIREVDGIEYLNSGDWVESNTALVEDYKGNWSIINF